MKIFKPENETKGYRNTGKTIQGLAELICALCWMATFLGCMAFFSSENYITAIIILVVGLLIPWISTRILQGFGELVENAEANRANTDRILFALTSIQKTLQTNAQQNKKEPEA